MPGRTERYLAVRIVAPANQLHHHLQIFQFSFINLSEHNEKKDFWVEKMTGTKFEKRNVIYILHMKYIVLWVNPPTEAEFVSHGWNNSKALHKTQHNCFSRWRSSKYCTKRPDCGQELISPKTSGPPLIWQNTLKTKEIKNFKFIESPDKEPIQCRLNPFFCALITPLLCSCLIFVRAQSGTSECVEY